MTHNVYLHSMLQVLGDRGHGSQAVHDLAAGLLRARGPDPWSVPAPAPIRAFPVILLPFHPFAALRCLCAWPCWMPACNAFQKAWFTV